MKKLLAAASVIAMTLLAAPAMADSHNWNHGGNWHHDNGWHRGHDRSYVYYQPIRPVPVYRYYAPPPVAYYPQPVYVAPYSGITSFFFRF